MIRSQQCFCPGDELIVFIVRIRKCEDKSGQFGFCCRLKRQKAKLIAEPKEFFGTKIEDAFCQVMSVVVVEKT